MLYGSSQVLQGWTGQRCLISAHTQTEVNNPRVVLNKDGVKCTLMFYAYP